MLTLEYHEKKTNIKRNVSKVKILRKNTLRRCESTHYVVVRYLHEKSYNVKPPRGGSRNFENECRLITLSTENAKREKLFYSSYIPNKLVFNESFPLRYYNSLCNSKIIFNGTFPIDKPFGIRKNLFSIESQVLKT